MTALPLADLLAQIYAQLGRDLNGATLCEAAAADHPLWPSADDLPMAVLALGKAAPAMLAGVMRATGSAAIGPALVIAPPGAAGGETLPAGVRRLTSDHPQPSERSLHAGLEIRRFVGDLLPPQRLLVLLSGGGSSLAVLPAPGIELHDKRDATSAVAHAGASIFELNAVRKHLSAIKGGQLAAACAVPVQVLALSDVLGDDPATIASGPFSADPTTFGNALALVNRLAPDVPPSVRAHLKAGAAGALPDTPKPGDPRLGHVRYRVIAGPDRVAEQARRLVEARAVTAGILSRNVGSPVPELAAAYIERARSEAATGGRIRVLIGNGEPTIVVPPAAPGTALRRGGRSTHLCLLVARGIAGLPGVAFLAAGTDDRDGNADGAGALVDGTTWDRAVAAGLDPEAALATADSARPLSALGCLVRSPGTSNLLDVHLLAVAAPEAITANITSA